MKFKLLLLCCLISIAAFAQSDPRIATSTTPLEEVQLVQMPTQDNKSLLEAELAAREPGRAPRFAVNLPVEITTHSHGTWEHLDNGMSVWRLRIQSEKAKSINFGFSQFFMPANGSLIIYDTQATEVMGPFTPMDNETHEQLWTPVFPTDELVIEVQVPSTSMDDLKLELSYVNHDYLGFNSVQSAILSGSCNLDVICGIDDGWEINEGYRDIIQSVAVIGTGGGTFCTGFLVNNTAQDCRPFFMTANHCGISNGNASSLVCYWNYQNSTCREPGSGASGGNGDGSLADFNTGSTFRASYANSDMTLVELDDPVSETANAFYAGWNAEFEMATDTIIGIHHPSTDEKRISYEFENVEPGQGLNGNITNINNATHVIVTDWNIGTTEGGSSGSPLFNKHKQVIGQLHGGAAACSNDAYDTYGWFHTSWTGGGTPATSLSSWLDPIGTGELSIAGRSAMACQFSVQASPANVAVCAPSDAVYSVSIGAAFDGMVTLSTSNVPTGVTATFASNPIMGGELVDLTLSGTENLAAGMYTIAISATDGNETADSEITLTITAETATVATLAMPMNNAMAVPSTPNFEWAADVASSYTLQVANDIAFADVVFEDATLTAPAFGGTTLDEETTYYWRVMSNNICGAADWSEVFTFTTSGSVCTLNTSADVPVNIPGQGTPTETSALEFTVPSSVVDVNVNNLVGTHSYLSDLTFTITSPAGTTVVLVAEQCGDTDDFNISFDDEAGSATLPCPYNDGNAYQPSGNLSDFDGENAAGTWTLTVSDSYNQDGGAIEGWELEICVSAPAMSATPDNFNVCQGEDVTFTVSISDSFGSDVDLSASGLPNGATINFDTNPAAPGSDVDGTISGLGLDAAGLNNIQINAQDVNGIFSATIIQVEVTTLPTIAGPQMPANGEVEVVLQPMLTWENTNNDNYTLEVATDDQFTNVIFQQTFTGTDYLFDSELDEETLYFWRVITENNCGTSTSATFNFTTEKVNSTNEINGSVVSIQPNPTTDKVIVAFSEMLNASVEIEVFSVNGQLLQSYQFASQLRMELDLTPLSSGMYLVKMKNENAILTQRIVKY